MREAKDAACGRHHDAGEVTEHLRGRGQHRLPVAGVIGVPAAPGLGRRPGPLFDFGHQGEQCGDVQARRFEAHRQAAGYGVDPPPPHTRRVTHLLVEGAGEFTAGTAGQPADFDVGGIRLGAHSALVPPRTRVDQGHELAGDTRSCLRGDRARRPVYRGAGGAHGCARHGGQQGNADTGGHGRDGHTDARSEHRRVERGCAALYRRTGCRRRHLDRCPQQRSGIPTPGHGARALSLLLGSSGGATTGHLPRGLAGYRSSVGRGP